MKDATARQQLADHDIAFRDVRSKLEKLVGRADALHDHLRGLDDKLEELARPVRDLEMEWQDYFEKFRNLYSRLSRRSEREAEPSKTREEAGANGLPSDMNPLAAALLRQGRPE